MTKEVVVLAGPFPLTTSVLQTKPGLHLNDRATKPSALHTFDSTDIRFAFTIDLPPRGRELQIADLDIPSTHFN